MATFHVYEVEATGEKDFFMSFTQGWAEKRSIEKERGNIRIIANYTWDELREILLKHKG